MTHKGTSRGSLYMWWSLGWLVPCRALGLTAASVGPGSAVGKLIYPPISPSTYTSLSTLLQESVQGGLWLNFILRLVQTSGSHCGGVIWNKTSLSGTLSWLMVSLDLGFKQGTALASFPQWTKRGHQSINANVSMNGSSFSYFEVTVITSSPFFSPLQWLPCTLPLPAQGWHQ